MSCMQEAQPWLQPPSHMVPQALLGIISEHKDRAVSEHCVVPNKGRKKRDSEGPNRQVYAQHV